MNSFKHITLFSAVFASSLFAGCYHKTHEQLENNENPKIEVITSFYPLAFFTEEIAKEHATVTNLSGKKSPHEYTISPQDRVQLENANLLIYQGAELEPWAEDLIPELEKKNLTILEVSHGLDLRKHDEHEEEDHDEDHDEGHEDHHHGEFDPHTWLDPVLAQEMVRSITDKLISVDPTNKEEYIENANMLIVKLKNLDDAYTAEFANCTKNEILISHDAFGYIEHRYGLILHAIAGLSPSDEPSAKLLAELKNISTEEGVTHILTEENNIKKYAETLAKETGLEMLPINPMGTTPSEGDYFSVSKANLSALSTASGCQ